MKKILLTFLLSTLVLPLFADDLNPPAWRDASRSTLQIWEFSLNDVNPLPDITTNPFPQPADVMPFAGDSWLDVYQGRQGVWPLSGEIYVPIWNYPEPLDEKRIWIQLTWRTKGSGPLLEASVPGGPMVDGSQIGDTILLPDGWNHSTYEIVLTPNPPEELVHIYGAIYLDEMVIDTICIPEPATMFLMAMGGFIALSKRK